MLEVEVVLVVEEPNRFMMNEYELCEMGGVYMWLE